MNTMKKIPVDEDGCKYILFRIDIYFNECFLAVETDEKGHTDKDIEKKLGCKFIGINKSSPKNGYEVGNVQAWIQIMRLVMYKHLLMSSK